MIFPRLNSPDPFGPQYGQTRQFDKDLANVLTILLSSLSNAFEKGINIADNLDAQVVTYTSNGSANTEDAIAHTLKRVPTGYIVVSQDKAGAFYTGSTAWTATSIYLRCSVATVAATVIIF